MERFILSGYDIKNKYFKEVEEEKRGIIYLGVPTSGRCNLNCIYCFSNGGKSLPNEIDLEERLDIIKQGKELGAKTIIIAEVGEPLLDPSIEEVIDYAHQNKLKTILYTNGTLIDEKRADFYYNKDVSLIVKIDSFDPIIHNKLVNTPEAYERVWKGLQILMDRGFSEVKENKKQKVTRLAIETIITNYNLESIPKIAEYCKDKNMKFISQMPVWVGRASDKIEDLIISKEEMIRLKKELKDNLLPFASQETECTMLKYGLVVGVTGDIKFCFADYSNILGNIRKINLKESLKIKKEKYGCSPKGCPMRNNFK